MLLKRKPAEKELSMKRAKSQAALKSVSELNNMLTILFVFASPTTKPNSELSLHHLRTFS